MIARPDSRAERLATSLDERMPWAIFRMIRTILLRLREYAANPDPLANAAGTIAIVVTVNQPFYPLYLHAIAGIAAWPAWLTLVSTPLFMAVPAVARSHPLAGRALLPIAGVANTVLCVKLFGIASAVELFLLPCVLLGRELGWIEGRTVAIEYHGRI